MRFKIGLDSLSTIPKTFIGVNWEGDQLYLAGLDQKIQGLSSIKIIEKIPIALKLDEIQHEIKKFVKKHLLHNQEAHFILNEQQYSFHLMEVPKVEPLELPKALKWICQDLVDYPIEDASIECIHLPWPRASDNAQMAYFIIVPKVHLIWVEDLFIDSGLKLKSIDIPEMAIRNLTQQLNDLQELNLFVYLGRKQTKFLLCEKGKIVFIRQMDLDCSYLQNANTLISAPEVQGLVDRLSLEIQRSYDYCATIYRQDISQLVTFFANQYFNPVIIQSLADLLGMAVKVVNLNDVVKSQENLNDWAYAIGAGLRQSENSSAIH